MPALQHLAHRALARRQGSAATTAATRSRCRSPAASAPTRCSRCAASAPSSSSGCSPSAIPEARLARMDLDTTSTKWSHQRILAAVETGEVDLLLGTQMIAKGLDFPNVTLVGRGGRRHRALPARTSARPSGPSSCWRRWRDGPDAGPRAGACWCRRGIRRTTRWSGRRSTTPRGSSGEERALRESPPYPPTTSLVNLVVSGPRRGGGGRARRGAGRLVLGAGGEARICR